MKKNNKEIVTNALRRKKADIPTDRTAPVVIYEDVVHNSKEPLTYNKLMSISFPPEEWVVESLIPKGLTILSAQPASFKTWLLLDLVMCVSQGKPFLDRFNTSMNGVLIVDEENSAQMLQKRIHMLGGSDDLNIRFFIEQGFKLNDETVQRLINTCFEHNLSFITFDSLVRIHEKNENDAVQMAEVFSQIRKLTKEGISVLLTHHNRKTGSDDNPSQSMRGSSDILASVDCHLSLKRVSNTDLLTLTQSKVRNAAELDPFDISIEYDDESMKLSYIEPANTTVLMRTDTTDSILEMLSNFDDMNQKEIFEELIRLDKKIGLKSLRAVLKSLTYKGDISIKRGVGNEFRYSIAG